MGEINSERNNSNSSMKTVMGEKGFLKGREKWFSLFEAVYGTKL
jgi:hypothetical protein